MRNSNPFPVCFTFASLLIYCSYQKFTMLIDRNSFHQDNFALLEYRDSMETDQLNPLQMYTYCLIAGSTYALGFRVLVKFAVP